MILLNEKTIVLCELQKRKLKRLFSMYDTSNSGVLRMADFQEVADRLASIKGLKKDSPEYARLVDRILHRWIHIRGEVKDRLHQRPGQSISLDEWLLYHEKVLADEAYRHRIHESFDLVFDALDADSSGDLSVKEFENLFRIYGIPVVYAAEAFARADANCDGHLSKAELVPLVEDYYYSQEPNAPANFIFGPI